MPFFTYHQNNTYGRWDTKMPRLLIVEASDAKTADLVAEANGVYFDGVTNGHDCGCCGDRWNRAWGDGDDAPSIYGEPIMDVNGVVETDARHAPILIIFAAPRASRRLAKGLAVKAAPYLMPVLGHPHPAGEDAPSAHRRWRVLSPMLQGYIEALYEDRHDWAFPYGLGFAALAPDSVRRLDEIVDAFAASRAWIEAYGALVDGWPYVRPVDWLAGFRAYRVSHENPTDWRFAWRCVFPETEWLAFADRLSAAARRLPAVETGYNGFDYTLEVSA